MRTLAFLVAATLLPFSSALAFDFGEEEEPARFELHGELSDYLFWRNDRDFDPTVPYYDEEGQSVGGVTSFFKGQFTYRPTDRVKLYYEGELGLNLYSRNNPDQWFPGADDYMAYKHREIWASYDLDLLTLKVGYQRLRDPSDLFLSHWCGAARLDLDLMRLRAGLTVGQLPDSTFEGVALTDNNFVHDNLLGGFELSYDLLPDSLRVDAGSWLLYDARVVRKELLLAVPYLGLAWQQGPFAIALHGLLQAGNWRQSGLGGIDQEILAWAVAARAGLTTTWLDVGASIFALSADDRHQGNERLGTFFYSGKNGSQTLMLTEDELRDRYDNLDEMVASRWGSFFLPQAGLGVADLSLTGKIGDRFRPQLVIGAGMVLEPDNAGGASFVGLEGDLVLRLRVVDQAWLVAAAQLFLPGEAAAIFVNDQDRQATEQIHGFQLGFTFTF